MQEIEYNEIFFVKISAVFLALTRPASSIVKPAAIHMTNAPITKKYNVSNAYANSMSCVSIRVS
jgi:hypothetical protein